MLYRNRNFPGKLREISYAFNEKRAEALLHASARDNPQLVRN